jgi:putative methyltransferase
MNVYLFQPQYTMLVDGIKNAWIPYSVGALWSYVSQFDDIRQHFELKELVFRRYPIQDLLDRMEDPVICGFSCYLWNRNYCLALAEAIKKKWPNCYILFGGPEVSGRMITYDFIDTLVQGEGEQNLVSVMRNIIAGTDPSVFTPKARMDDLEIPSPYLDGLFDKIIKDNPEYRWAMTLETNRGCPYSCTFCDWGSLTYSKVKKFNLDKIKAEIDWIRDKPIAYLYLADANFGIFKERDLEISRYINSVISDHPTVDAVGIQSAKQSKQDCFDIAQALGEKCSGVSVAMQSMHDDTLVAIKRKNLDVNNVRGLMKLSREYQIPTYTELILGLPLETKESWIEGMADLLEAGQHNAIEMWFTQLLENSELNQPMDRMKYGIKTIKSSQYISLRGPDDHDGIAEIAELIKSTNTMTTAEMIECYLFGWLIIQFHTQGYTQLISRYMRYAHGVSFKDFYLHIESEITKDPQMNEQRNIIKHALETFLETGTVGPGLAGHMIHASTGSWIYDNRKYIMNFVARCAEKFAKVPNEIVKLQDAQIFDRDQKYPIQITCDFDLYNEDASATTYEISPRLKQLGSLNTAVMRRRGLLKNKIIKKHD